MYTILTFSQIASSVTCIIAALLFLIKPIRNGILGLGKIQNGQKCLLRSAMLSIYYKNLENRTIRQYEYENFIYLYQAYKELGGNSFIDKIKSEVNTWEIIS